MNRKPKAARPQSDSPSPALTLHEAVSVRMAAFDELARQAAEAGLDEAGLDEAVRAIEDQRAMYLAESIPFIREYFDVTDRNDRDDRTDEPLNGGFHARVGAKKPNKRSVLQRYMRDVESLNCAVDDERYDESSEYTCACGGRKNFEYATWDAICESCGAVTTIGLGHSRGGNEWALVSQNQRDGLTTTHHAAYKRINHFNDWLNKLQGKEGTEVPEEVLNALRAELKKYRVTSSADITPERMRQYLKKLRMDKYYDNVYSIAHTLGGPPPRRFPADLETRLKEMFVKVQTPWEQTKPPKRKNFLSYAYSLHKFCELLGADEYLESLLLLKSSEKLHGQDEMWRNVCGVLGWEFIPSAA